MDTVTTLTDQRLARRTRGQRYRHSLWILTKRDLKVRYATNALGWVWSVLDPLLMSGIYYFVFVVIFHRGAKLGETPYIVFLIAALLPWMWFNGAVSDFTRAFSKEAKLIRSTMIPRAIWVHRLVLSKGIEFLLSLPVLIVFAIVFHSAVNIDVLLFPLAIVMQGAFILGLGLILAPLTVFVNDLERAVKLILRLMFYASPIVYSARSVPHGLHLIMALNPLSGIFGIYRSTFFHQELNWYHVGMGSIVIVLTLVIGILVFRRMERAVLKEL